MYTRLRPKTRKSKQSKVRQLEETSGKLYYVIYKSKQNYGKKYA